jgi:integrase
LTRSFAAAKTGRRDSVRGDEKDEESMKRTKTKRRGVTRLGPDLHEIRVRITDPRSGIRKELRRVERLTFKEACALQERMEQELEGAVECPEDKRERLTLGEFARSWLAGRLARDKYRPGAAEKLTINLDLHILPALGSYYLDALRPSDVEKWLAPQLEAMKTPKLDAEGKPILSRDGKPKMMLAPITVAGRYANLRTVVRAAAKLGHCSDFVSAVEPPTVRKVTTNYLRAEQARKLFEALPAIAPQWTAMLYLLTFTALRWAEASALRWEDLDPEHGVIRVNRGQYKGQVTDLTKTGKAKEVPLTTDIERALAEHRRWMIEAQHPGLPSGWIFPTWGARAGKSEERAGELHVGNPFNDALTRACERAGIPRITPHGLRHTGNDLLRRFASREVVMSITGHSTPAMHSHYSHVDAGEKAAAVGKVIELVTKKAPSDQQRGEKRGEFLDPDRLTAATG